MAYTIPNKPKGPRPSLDDFEKRASTGSLFMRGKPTIVPIHPETGNRVEVNKKSDAQRDKEQKVISELGPTSQPGSRRPSIYAQLDELTSAENSTATPLYRTFTVPRASLVAQTSVELPSITIQVNTQTEEN
ncbi:unnamed protein product, partial [Mesorhabditis spiculigera]